MRQYWQGDLLVHHLSHLAFRIEKGTPAYIGDERGGNWAVLEAFPNLTASILDTKIQIAIKGFELKAIEKIAQCKLTLEQESKKLETIVANINQQ